MQLTIIAKVCKNDITSVISYVAMTDDRELMELSHDRLTDYFYTNGYVRMNNNVTQFVQNRGSKVQHVYKFLENDWKKLPQSSKNTLYNLQKALEAKKIWCNPSEFKVI